MTILTIPENDRRERFLASAGQTVFSFDFPVYAPEDLDVRRFRNGVETVLTYGALADYTVTGAGLQGGGNITLTVGAQLNDLIVIRSDQSESRASTYYGGGDLRAEAINADLNRFWIAQQQLRLALGQTLRLPVSDPQDAAELPTAASRANGVPVFGAAGELLVVPRITIGGGSFQQSGTGAVVRTQQDELAERIHPKQFGATADGSADDTLPVQNAANEAAAKGAYLDLSRGTFRITATVTVPGGAAGVFGGGLIRYDGGAGQVALVLGDGGAAANQFKRYLGLRVERVTQADWTNEGDIGIVARNLDNCILEVLMVKGFTIGLRTLGDQRGFEDSIVQLGRLWNCRYGLDVRTVAAGAWNNAVRYIGGHFANDSALHPTLGRFGVRFSREPGGYDLHNHHVFVGPAFELQRQGTPGTVDAIPFLLEVSGRGLHATGIRMEACSTSVARHTADFNDAVYETAFVGTYAYLGAGVEYGAAAGRAGGSARPLHQAAAALSSPRLIAAAESVRGRAFRWTSTEVGFEGMGLLSSNPAGPPTNLTGYVFPGLSSLTLNADSVTLPTSRAAVFVVRTDICKEVFIGADGSELRPVVMQFDASENVLTSPTARALFSNMNAVWVTSPANWWEGNADLDSLTGGFALNRLQRVTLDSACAFAAIGVRGGSASAQLRALRLFVAGDQAPQVLAGGTRRWGTRELSAVQTWDPPSVAAGATTTVNVAVTDAVPGDLCDVGFTLATTLPFLAGIGASGQITVRLWNPTGGAVDLGSGDLHVRAVKPRL